MYTTSDVWAAVSPVAMSGVGLDGAKGVLPRASSSSMAQRPTRETEKGRGQQRSYRPATTITSSTRTAATSSVTSKTQQTDGRRGGEERRKVKSKNVGARHWRPKRRDTGLDSVTHIKREGEGEGEREFWVEHSLFFVRVIRCLNEELEAKTASLVREAEEIMVSVCMYINVKCYT